MKIKNILAKEVPPVKHFEVNNLSDTVIIAGPNGSGKTRLIDALINYLQSPSINQNMKLLIEATNKSELEQWGKKNIDTSVQEDIQKFVATLHQNRRRIKWKSSIIRFESDRTIRKVQPFLFSWDITDPDEEDIGWNSTFSFMHDRFTDSLHSIFRKIEHQKQSIATQAIQLKKRGKSSMNLNFDDPIKPFKDAFYSLLAPKTLIDPSPKKQTLEYEDNGQIRNINTLSSGEREVVNIIFDFLLRNPEDCIVFFDEPDLHLHPELCYKLIQTLKSLGKNNQFILCTHSSEIITSSLDNSVIFLSMDKENEENQAIPIDENDETNKALKLIGHSIGIIALGKKIVFVEGQNSSLDKQTYGAIIKDKFPNLVLVPSGGKDNIVAFSSIVERILSKTLWGVQFFMLCDMDAIPYHDKEENLESASNNRLRILNKYHLENYFLDENVWAEIFRELDPEESWLTSRDEIHNYFKEIAKEQLSYALSLKVASKFRRLVGNIDIMVKGCNNKSIDELKELFAQKTDSENARVSEKTNIEKINEEIDSIYTRLNDSLKNDNEIWKNEIPGKPILHAFISKASMQIGRAKNLFIKKAETLSDSPFKDILNIFKSFSDM